MNKIKNLFATPGKAACTFICLLLIIIAAGAITIYATNTMVENSSIGTNNALNFACADAEIDPVSAENVSIAFSHKQGQFVYEVEFIHENTEYVYWVRASDGSIVKKNQNVIIAKNAAESETEIQTKAPATETNAEPSKSMETTAASNSVSGTNAASNSASKISADSNSASDTNAASSKASSETKSSSGQISLEDAKSAALSDAGVSASEATFTTSKLEHDDGIAAYEMEFYTSTHEYEYEINAANGAIISKKSEAFQKNNPSSSGNEGSYISVEQAKNIALNHAGVSASDVSFSKAKLEKDEGYAVYEVEFYDNKTEYEYTIDAYEGTILEYDVD